MDKRENIRVLNDYLNRHGYQIAIEKGHVVIRDYGETHGYYCSWEFNIYGNHRLLQFCEETANTDFKRYRSKYEKLTLLLIAWLQSNVLEPIVSKFTNDPKDK